MGLLRPRRRVAWDLAIGWSTPAHGQGVVRRGSTPPHSPRPASRGAADRHLVGWGVSMADRSPSTECQRQVAPKALPSWHRGSRNRASLAGAPPRRLNGPSKRGCDRAGLDRIPSRCPAAPGRWRCSAGTVGLGLKAPLAGRARSRLPYRHHCQPPPRFFNRGRLKTTPHGLSGEIPIRIETAPGHRSLGVTVCAWVTSKVCPIDWESSSTDAR